MSNNIMQQFQRVPLGKEDETMETIMAYEECYMKLLKIYKPEIQWIADMQKELRDERDAFIEHYVQIEAAMKNDDVLSKEVKEEWLRQYYANMESSFKASELLLEKYVEKNLNEFEQALNEAKRKV